MRPAACAALLASALLSGEALADPAADLQTAIGLRRKPAEARRLFESVASAPGASNALRAEASLRRGCLAINDAEGGSIESATEVAKDWFGRALRLDAKARSPEDWNPRCEELFVAAQASARADAKPPPTQTQPVTRPAQPSGSTKADLERERAERLKLQERLEGLRKEVGALRERDKDAANERVGAMERTIDELRADVKARDERILAMSLKLEQETPKPIDRRIPTFVLGGVAIGALGAGIGFGVSAMASKSAFDGTQNQAEAARHAADGRRSMVVADACYGGAVALAATAALVYFLSPSPEPEEARR